MRLKPLRCFYDENIDMCKKAFSVGVRIEHKQEMIKKASTAIFASISKMLTISCRIICRTGAECIHFVCPGGYVVNSASEEGSIVTNGMSHSKETREMQTVRFW